MSQMVDALGDELDGRKVSVRIFCVESTGKSPDIRIVSGLKELLADPYFNQADLHIYAFGGYCEIFDSIRFIAAHSRSIVFYHGVTPVHLFGNREAAWLTQNQKLNMRIADAVCCASPYSAAQIRLLGVVEDRLHVVPLPVSFFPEQMIKRDQGMIVHFMTVGRLVYNKGTLDAVKALALCIQAGIYNLRLRVVGGLQSTQPDYVKQIENYVKDNNLTPYVEFVGQVDDDRALSQLYVQTDAVLLPSYHDSYCLPVLESFAHGCCVIGYDSTNLPHICNGYGMLVPTGDVAALAKAMQEFIRGLLKTSAIVDVKRGSFNFEEYRNEVIRYAGTNSVVTFRSHMRNLFAAVRRQLPCANVTTFDKIKIDASALYFRSTYRQPDQDIVRGEAIHFYAGAMDGDEGDILFFGPSIPLETGRYELDLGAKITGHFRFRVSDDQGKKRLYDKVIGPDTKRITFRVKRPLMKFETVLLRLHSSQIFVTDGLTLTRQRATTR